MKAGSHSSAMTAQMGPSDGRIGVRSILCIKTNGEAAEARISGCGVPPDSTDAQPSVPHGSRSTAVNRRAMCLKKKASAGQTYWYR
jgi:hypothetical protein